MGLIKSLTYHIKELLQTFLVVLAVFLVVYNFIAQPHRIRGDSMKPNFADGELLLVEKISYRFGEPQRGDVVVFKAPVGQNVSFIKRLVGLPGETLKIENGMIFINNRQLKEPYEIQTTQGQLEVVLGSNEYFVLGDNRRSSSDSRSFGPIEKKTIKAKAWFVYWPILPADESAGWRFVSGADYGVADSSDNR